MSEQPGRGLPDSHLLPDAVVAFVDAELSAGAHERAAEHLVHCAACVAEVTAQRQVRTAVRGAPEPSMSAGFLANLRSIPEDTDVSESPGVVGELAVAEDGQLVSVQRPDKVADTDRVRLDESERLQGESQGGAQPLLRRTAQGAGVVVSGVVLSAIALVTTGDLGMVQQNGSEVPPQPRSNVMRAQFDVPGAAGTQHSSHSSSSMSSRSPTPSRAGAPPSVRSTTRTPMPSGSVALSGGKR